MKKIALCISLASVSLSIYPAKVLIRNQTNEPVLARINNQKRSFRFWEDQKMTQGLFREVISGGNQEIPNIIPLSEPIAEPIFAAHRALSGYPNFIPINPEKSEVLGTALLRRNRPEEGGVLGEPITTITFAQVIGFKEISGTIAELKKQVNNLAKQYGGIKLVDLSKKIELKTIFNKNSFYKTKQALEKTPQKIWQKTSEGWQKTTPATYSITIPLFKEFKYHLGKNKIGRKEKGIVELKSWGNAIFNRKI